MAGRRASVKDVAVHAGVSVGTVSNVLNRPDAVAPATRERVEEAMRALNFIRNASAHQLRAGYSRTVGVIVLDLRNPFYTELARGIEDRLAVDNNTLMLCSSDEDPAREERFMRLFAEQGVRGLLVTPFETTRERLGKFQKLGIPTVLLDSASTRLPSVGMDNVSGARQAVDHLLRNGHRRIGLIMGPETIDQVSDRVTGATRAVTDLGLDPRSVLIRTEDTALDADGGQRCLRALLDSPAAAGMTAVMCINDIVALGAMRELRLRGLRIPQDIAVIGYDDVMFASELMTPLTSVRQPMRELGWAAVDLLLTNPSAPQHIEFVPELIVRASSDYVRPGSR